MQIVTNEKDGETVKLIGRYSVDNDCYADGKTFDYNDNIRFEVYSVNDNSWIIEILVW